MIALSAAERETWSALGLTRAQRSIALALPPGGAVVVGTLLAVIGAWLASPLMPMGLARGRAGTRVPLRRAGARGRRCRDGGGARRNGACGRVATRAPGEHPGHSPSVRTGTRAREHQPRTLARDRVPRQSNRDADRRDPHTLGPHRRDRRRRRSRLRLDLRTEPRSARDDADAVRTAWDIAVDDNHAVRPDPDRPCSGLRATRVARQPGLDDVAAICNLSVEIEGHPVYALGYTSMRGTIAPTVLDGRAPRTAGEIGLGTDTLETIHKEIGDRVRMQGPGGTAQLRIVARVVVPSLGDAQAVADGAILTGAGLDRVDEPSAELSHAWVVATTADHVDPRQSNGASHGFQTWETPRQSALKPRGFLSRFDASSRSRTSPTSSPASSRCLERRRSATHWRPPSAAVEASSRS